MKGKAKNQDYYAKQMGTTKRGTNMEVLGKCLTKKADAGYVYAGIIKKKYFKNRIWVDIIAKGSIGLKKTPVALDINTENKDWPYSTSGHFLSVSGARTDMLWVRVSDSVLTSKEAKKAKNKKRGKHRKRKLGNVYLVAMNHWRQAMIWKAERRTYCEKDNNNCDYGACFDTWTDCL